MTITVPDIFQAKFDQFDRVEALLIDAYRSDRGVSRMQICRMFGAVSTASSCWRDPAFLVWAGLRDCTKSDDFLARWDAMRSTQDIHA